MGIPSGKNPFASVAARRKRALPPDAFTADLVDTELDPDPFRANAVRKERMTPRASLSSLDRLAGGRAEPLSLRERAFNVGIPEQLIGTDESIRGYESALEDLPELLYPTRERDENFSLPKAFLAETVPNFFGALRSAGSPVGQAQNVAGRVGRVASGAMAGEGFQQMREGDFWGGLTNMALGALGAFAGINPKKKPDFSGPRPAPQRPIGPRPEGFAPRSTSPLDEAWADRVLAESKELEPFNDLRSKNDRLADDILQSSRDLGLDDFDPRTGELRDDIPFEALIQKGYTREQILRSRARRVPEMRYAPAERQARELFDQDNAGSNVQGGIEPPVRQVQGEIVDDPFAAIASEPAPVDSTRPLGNVGTPPTEGAVGAQASAATDDLSAVRRQLQREGYPPQLIDRVLAEMQAGNAQPKFGRVEPSPVAPGPEPLVPPTPPPVETAAPAASSTVDPLEELLGPTAEYETIVDANGNVLGEAPIGYAGPERRGANRMSSADWEAQVARQRQTEIQERMQRGEIGLEDTIAERPDADLKARGEAARQAQAEAEGRPKGRASQAAPEGVDSGRADVEEGVRPPDRSAEPEPPDAGGLVLRPGEGDRTLGGGAARRSPTDEYFDELLRGARERGYAGTDEDLRSLYDDNVRATRELIEDLEQITGEFGPDALLREIRKRGGITSFSKDVNTLTRRTKRSYGDLQNLVQQFEKTRGQRGASSIFRDKGVGLDAMAQSLAESGWPGITSLEDLEDVLEQIARSADDRAAGWGAPDIIEALAGQGLRPDAPWWPGGLDTSFDFGANVPDAPTGAVDDLVDLLDTGEAQPRLPGAGGARQVGQADTTFRAPQQATGNDFSLAALETPEAAAARERAESPSLLGLEEAPDEAIAQLEALVAPRVRQYPEGLTVYHGTPENFTSFDPDVPAFFAEDPAVANKYAEGSKKAVGNSPRVIPARLEANAVLDVDSSFDLDPPDLERLAGVFDMQPEAAAVQFRRAMAQRDFRMIRSWIEKAGFDALRFPYRGESPAWMPVHPRQATSTSGAPLWREGAPAGAAPRANRIPENVRDFLVKQLGWTDADLAAMSPTELYRLGREKVRNPNAAPRPQRPATVKTQPEGTPYTEKLAEGPIAEDLEQFLELEVPRREAQAAARTARARERAGISTSRINQPGARSIAPAVRQPKAAEKNPSIGFPTEGPAAGETLSEAQRRKAKLQGAQKEAGRNLDRAFDSGDYKGFATQLGEMVERYWKRQTKMGTGAADLRRGDTGTVLEGSIVPGFSMAAKVLKDPAKYAELSREMLANPGIRAVLGGLTGYAVDDDEPMRGALYGAIAAAAGPSGARALAKSIRNLRSGKPMTPFQDPKNRDVSRWRLAYGPSLESSVPDVFRKVRELETQLSEMYEGAWTKETKVATAKHTREMVGRVLADAAKEAKGAGQKRKAWLLEGYARRYRGVPTVGQQTVQKVADTVFGKGKIDAQAIERHANQLIHRTMIGYALDSAAQNLSQPTLALLWVSPKNLARGWRSARSAAGKRVAEANIPKLAAYKGQDIVSEAEELLTGAAKGRESMLSEPGFPLRMTDEFNRRSVYLAALDQKGWLDRALQGQAVPKDINEWALSKMRRTQGDPGALGKNPFHRGPLAGPAAAFQKYPGLFLENLADAFTDPEARGKAFVASLMGLMAAGHIMGIDVAEMYFSGARPLGIDPLHPQETLRRGARALPGPRGVMDVLDHIGGTADHPFMGTPGKDFLQGDLATLLGGRYAMKFAQKGGEVLSEGLGQHQPESETDTRAPHTGVEDLMNLVGLRSERQTEATAAGREAARFRERAIQERREQSRDKRSALEDAIRSGDRQRVLEAERAMSPAQKREFYRRRRMTPYERRREAIPRERRQEFDERFRDRLDR